MDWEVFGVVKLEPSSFLVSWFYYYDYLIASSYCSTFFIVSICLLEHYTLHGWQTLQISQEINFLHTYCFIVFHLITCPIPTITLQAFFPALCGHTCSTLHGHSDMVVIMWCCGLHKTCCFLLIVIFILISWGNKVFTRYRLQIQQWATCNRIVNTTEPTHVTSNLFSQNIGTLSLPIISSAHSYRISFQINNLYIYTLLLASRGNQDCIPRPDASFCIIRILNDLFNISQIAKLAYILPHLSVSENTTGYLILLNLWEISGNHDTEF